MMEQERCQHGSWNASDEDNHILSSHSRLWLSSLPSIGLGSPWDSVSLLQMCFGTGLIAYIWLRLSPRKMLGKISNKRHDSSQASPMAKRKQEFLARNLNEYGYRSTPGGYIDDWRPVEFPTLIRPLKEGVASQDGYLRNDGPSEIYLDYAGAALPTQSQLSNIYRNLSSRNILANPHSSGPAASRSLEVMQQVRMKVLSHLDATPGRYASMQNPPVGASTEQRHPGYDMTFTSGATDGLRLLGERFPWRTPCPCCGRQSVFLYAKNSHTSVMGIRNLALKSGARFECRTAEEVARMSSASFDRIFNSISTEGNCSQCSVDNYPNLLAIPAECNFGGSRLDVSSIIRVANSAESVWYSLVDIAKAASTSPISLKRMNADFAVLSFYKLFGEPTGSGALMVKSITVHLLMGGRHYQGGGSVDFVLSGRDFTVARPNGLAALGHGSAHFRGMQSLLFGFDELERVGGMECVLAHTMCLARELVCRLRSLHHGNGQKAIELVGGRVNSSAPHHCCGPVVTFNILRDDGTFVGCNEVSKLAALHHPAIQFRTGCFCNPGGCQTALGLTDEQLITNFEITGHVCGDHIDIINGTPTGAIRISFGKDNIWEDLDLFVQFIRKTFVNDLSILNRKTQKDPETTQVVISELFLFPIKSCSSQRVHRWPIEAPSGKLQHDREFALVDSSGKALRLQSCPKMVTIEPNINLDSGEMTVSAPGMDDLIVSLTDNQLCNATDVVQVCGNKCGGRLWGDHRASEWFSSYLGIQCWLARFQGDASLASGRNSSSRSGYANEQALLLISENTVGLLNDVLQTQNQNAVGSRHFRPNIVVRSTVFDDSHIEDNWTSVAILRNSVCFSTKGNCARCAMVDFDPCTGKKGKTLRALSTYRRQNGQIMFGIFLAATSFDGNSNENVWIEVGDTLLCSQSAIPFK